MRLNGRQQDVTKAESPEDPLSGGRKVVLLSLIALTSCAIPLPASTSRSRLLCTVTWLLNPLQGTSTWSASMACRRWAGEYLHEAMW